VPSSFVYNIENVLLLKDSVVVPGELEIHYIKITLAKVRSGVSTKLRFDSISCRIICFLGN